MSYHITTIAVDGGVTIGRVLTVPVANRQIRDRLGKADMQLVPEFTEYGGAPCLAFCDEEGKPKGLPMNPKATYLWYACLAPHPFRPDTLHGPIVIVTADDPADLQNL